jgi:hypothetical protein
MSRTRIVVAGWMLGAPLLGCATPNSVTYAAINAPPRAFVRRTPETVDVFVGKPPTRPHVDVGMFEVYQGRDAQGVGRSTEAMFGTLRAHAALRGCDAGQVLGVELAARSYGRIVRGVCEIYTDEQAARDASQRPAPPPLQGEGAQCTPPQPTLGDEPIRAATGCPEPLSCSPKGVCASPYR